MKKSNIVSENYSIAAAEILEILNYFPSNILNKVPRQLIDYFEEVSEKDYKPQINYSRRIGKS